MGLLTPKGNKGDKKKNNASKNSNSQSKFLTNKNAKGGPKKLLTGGSQRGS